MLRQIARETRRVPGELAERSVLKLHSGVLHLHPFCTISSINHSNLTRIIEVFGKPGLALSLRD